MMDQDWYPLLLHCGVLHLIMVVMVVVVVEVAIVVVVVVVSADVVSFSS
jgi:hypothetical protein